MIGRTSAPALLLESCMLLSVTLFNPSDVSEGSNSSSTGNLPPSSTSDRPSVDRIARVAQECLRQHQRAFTEYPSV